jgi:uncharacterized membrane protein HdeD (DUF308 family)
MLQVFLEKGPWFRAKKYGYGAGLPFKWQGWVVLGVYLLALVPLVIISKQDGATPKIIGLALMISATVTLLVIVRKRTEGGWKWRGDYGA